jgi:hypothetical protein
MTEKVTGKKPGILPEERRHRLALIDLALIRAGASGGNVDRRRSITPTRKKSIKKLREIMDSVQE